MKLLYRSKGCDFYTEESEFTPQVGWTVTVTEKQKFTIVEIELPLHSEEPVVIIHMVQKDVEILDMPKRKTVMVVEVYERSKDNLTHGKCYEILRENEFRNTFMIKVDNGTKRWFKKDNMQFRFID